MVELITVSQIISNDYKDNSNDCLIRLSEKFTACKTSLLS